MTRADAGRELQAWLGRYNDIALTDDLVGMLEGAAAFLKRRERVHQLRARTAELLLIETMGAQQRGRLQARYRQLDQEVDELSQRLELP